MAIPVQQARGIFTKIYLESYKETIPAPSFLKSFFNVVTTAAKSVAIEVMRGTERIAVDVLRGTDGNRNTWSRFTEKEYVPPFFNENFDATMLDRYDRVFGAELSLTPATIGYLAQDVAMKYQDLRAKIERAKEYMAAQVFETGVITMQNGDNIDFKRKAGSIVDLSATPWSQAATDVETQLIAGCEFIRTKGKNGVPAFNIVMSGAAWVALKKTDYFKNNANYRQVQLIDVMMPQKEAWGAGYHGTIVAGAYTLNVWTYDETYEDSTGTTQRYWPITHAVIIPTSGSRLVMAHAGVPAIIRDASRAEFPEYIVNQAGEYWLNNYIDPKAKSHTFEIMSAPVAIPVTVDMIYTMKVLGDANPQQG